MGCIQSKEAVVKTRNGKAAPGCGGGGDGGGVGVGDPLNPSVALGNMLGQAQHLHLGNIGKKGNQVFKEGAHHLKNIFALPFDALPFDYNPPVYKKTEQEKEFIEKSLKNSSFLFNDMSHLELFPLIQAFEKQQVKAGTVLIKEGDDGDFFYIIQSGAVEFSVDGNVIGNAAPGATFGELSLLYTCPRAATVTTKQDTALFRVDQKAFRFILRTQTEESGAMKRRLLKGVHFVKGLSDSLLEKLARNMTPRHFKKDEILVEKTDEDCYFWIIEKGEIEIQNVNSGGGRYTNIKLKEGEYFGQLAMALGKKQYEKIVALTDGRAFRIDEETFKSTMGELAKLLVRSMDVNLLADMQIIKDTKLDSKTIQTLAGFVKEVSFHSGQYIMKEGEHTDAAMYFVRKGKLHLKSSTRDEVYEGVSALGGELLLTDAITGKNSPTDTTSVPAPFTVHAVEDSRIGVLSLLDARKVVDTIYMGRGIAVAQDSLIERKVQLKDLTKHRILGAGTFGQVWLVSRETADGEQRAYALKVQSKYELCKSGQAKAVVREKNVMTRLHHPLICKLVGAFQDKTFVYMLMDLVQGGELYGIMHSPKRDYLPEDEAVFYVAGIHEALSYMHRVGYCYRDLKPENVLINMKGYPVIVDLGFAKYIEDKTYTLCGTPVYIPPEVILNRGYDGGADHWSLGILMYEMLTGVTPFFKQGMNQMELFRAIVKGRFDIPRYISQKGNDLLKGLIKRDPTKRLGSLAGGERDIFRHPWFSMIEFKELRWMTIKAPYIPKIKNFLQVANFEDWSHLEDKLKKNYEELTASQQEIFVTF